MNGGGSGRARRSQVAEAAIDCAAGILGNVVFSITRWSQPRLVYSRLFFPTVGSPSFFGPSACCSFTAYRQKNVVRREAHVKQRVIRALRYVVFASEVTVNALSDAVKLLPY